VQNLRKSADYEVTDRIRLRYDGGEECARVFDAQGGLIGSETLADDIDAGAAEWVDNTELKIGDEAVRLWIQKID
jgi:isoleucyl-tRNA synthetase